MSDLPAGWADGTLADFAEPRGERVLPSSMPDAVFLGMDHVEAQTTRIVGGAPARGLKSTAARFHAGDVIYGRLRPYLNKVAIPPFDGLASAEFIVFPDTAWLDASFLKYRLNAADFVSFSSHLNEGDRPRVSFAQIGAFPMRIPPRREQRRIVSKIDELFSELDKGMEALTTAREQLRVYRQSLLKYAFEGRLTEAWRSQNRDRLETSDALRARLEQSREGAHQTRLSRWHAALKQWAPRGKAAPKPRKPRDPKPVARLSSEAMDALPQLPKGWLWDSLGWMTLGVEYGTAAKSSSSGKVAVIRMGNIQNAKIDWTDLVYTSNDDEIEAYALNPGDVLFNRTNSPELVGKTAIYRGERPALFAGYLIRVSHNPDVVDGQYLNLFLNSHVAHTHGNAVKTDGVNQSNINGEKLSRYPFPYCSIHEQREVVKILDHRLSLVDQAEGQIGQELRRAQALRQAILARAFSGDLVPQDASDEPASVLLQRIRVEREAAESEPTPMRKTRTQPV